MLLKCAFGIRIFILRRNKQLTFSEYALVLERNIIRLQRQIEKREKVIEQIELKYSEQEKSDAIQLQLDNTRKKVNLLEHELASKRDEYMSFKKNL
ncbi:MAG: hypothetical protein RSC90_11745 [Clostridia bacterium]